MQKQDDNNSDWKFLIEMVWWRNRDCRAIQFRSFQMKTVGRRIPIGNFQASPWCTGGGCGPLNRGAILAASSGILVPRRGVPGEEEQGQRCSITLFFDFCFFKASSELDSGVSQA